MSFHRLSKTTRNIFDALIDICVVLAGWHEAAYSQWYEKYITSMAGLYKKIRSLLDEDNGVCTPTNINPSVSLASITSDTYTAKNEEYEEANNASLIADDNSSSDTPVHKSFASSPTDDISFSFVPNCSIDNSKSIHLRKVCIVGCKHNFN